MAVCRHARCRELALGRKLWVRALLSGPESGPAPFHWAPQPEREWVWGEAWESAFLTSTTWDLVALAQPSLPVSMGCGLAERVHVTLGGCRNSIPVHGSYQGVRTTLQQQTNQLKIPCKPREGGFCKRNNKKRKQKPVTGTSKATVEDARAGVELVTYQQRLQAVGEFLSSSPHRAPPSLPPWPQHPGGAAGKSGH